MTDEKKPLVMTAEDREKLAEELAPMVVTLLLAKVKEPEEVERFGQAWGNYFDRALGRGMRRLGVLVIGAVIGIGAVKFELLSKLLR